MDMVIPALAGASSLLAAGAVLYRTIRPRFPVEVNCHFCNANTQVPYGNQNCWDCPTCEQYNGFSENGDYNKPIPAQEAEDMNHPISAEHRPQSDFCSGSESVLCKTCTSNQLLKVKQLSNFVAYEESNYDAEVDAYQQNLEHVYKLCRDCKKRVNRSLRKQDEFLYKKNSCSENESPVRANSSPHAPLFNTSAFCPIQIPWYVHLLRFLVLISSLLLLIGGLDSLMRGSWFSMSSPGRLTSVFSHAASAIGQRSLCVVCAGLVLNICAIVLAGKESVSPMDSASCLLWFMLLVLHSASRVPLLVDTQVLKLQLLLTLLMCGVAVWCLLGPRYRRAVSSTRIKTRRLRPSLSNSQSPSQFNDTISQDVFHDLPSQSSTSSERQNIEPDVEFHDPLDDLETLSIGKPAELNEAGPFSVSQPLTGQQTGMNGLKSLRYRPLLTPARFAANQLNAPLITKQLPRQQTTGNHAFVMPTIATTMPTLNPFRTNNKPAPNLFTTNSSIFGNTTSGFSNGGTVLGNSHGHGLADNRSIFSTTTNGLGSGDSIFTHGIKSVQGTRSVKVHSKSNHGNSIHSNSGSVLGNSSHLFANRAMHSDQIINDRTSHFSENHQNPLSNLSNDSAGTSSNESFICQNRTSTPVGAFSDVGLAKKLDASVRAKMSPVLWSISIFFNLCFFGYVFLYLFDYRSFLSMKHMQSILGMGSIVTRIADLIGIPTDALY